MPLVPTHDQTARLAPEVDEQRRVAQCGHVDRDAVRPRDQVLMRHRDHGHVDSRQGGDLRSEHPARVDDDLGLDRTPVGLDAGDAPPLHPDARDAGLRRP